MLLLLKQFFIFVIFCHFPHFIQYKLYKHKLWNKLFEITIKKKYLDLIKLPSNNFLYLNKNNNQPPNLVNMLGLREKCSSVPLLLILKFSILWYENFPHLLEPEHIKCDNIELIQHPYPWPKVSAKTTCKIQCVRGSLRWCITDLAP